MLQYFRFMTLITEIKRIKKQLILYHIIYTNKKGCKKIIQKYIRINEQNLNQHIMKINKIKQKIIFTNKK